MALRHPAVAFQSDERIGDQWRPLSYHRPPRLAAAVDEYDRLIAFLRSCGVAVDLLPAGPDLTLDALYVRDATLISPRGQIGCAMGKAARRAESAVNLQALAAAGIAVHGRIEPPGKLEGGDFVWFDARTAAVGQGYRTNGAGIEQLRRLLGSEVEVVVAHLPHHRGENDVFHLMSILSPLDEDLALVFSPLMPVMFRQWLLARGIELVEVDEEEFARMGCNVLALAPRVCLMLEGLPATRRRLEAAGCEVLSYCGEEISRPGEGGPTCLTRPLVRA